MARVSYYGVKRKMLAFVMRPASEKKERIKEKKLGLSIHLKVCHLNALH